VKEGAPVSNIEELNDKLVAFMKHRISIMGSDAGGLYGY
jgi:hypothetical protein